MIGYGFMVMGILKMVEVASENAITMITYSLINSGYGIHIIVAYYYQAATPDFIHYE